MWRQCSVCPAVLREYIPVIRKFTQKTMDGEWKEESAQMTQQMGQNINNGWLWAKGTWVLIFLF